MLFRSQVKYPAPGAPDLAKRVAALLEQAGLPAHIDPQQGLDHGAWSVLMHYAPVADVPVVQLSIDRTQPASFHYQIGQRLAPMRDEGVLIAGSGDVVHNLRHMNLAPGAPAYPWAQRFHDRVKEAIVREDHTSLVNFGLMGDDAVQSVPTPEHYLPLLYVLGARRFDDQVRFFTVSIDLGSISMLGVQVGI